ncbi:MAG: hypothetical protein NC241_05080 [Bacteroides sp.]|nr:hypothetical protein [Bacteroides sp.]MCM1457400.1 hypothetical protein [Lachnoclostridium sp.]
MICDYCHSHIKGYYYEDWAGHHICSGHVDSGEVPRCDSCGQYITSRDKCREVERGRHICLACLANEVTDENFEWVLNQVMRRLYNAGFQDIQPDWITFRMVTKKEMSNALSENAAGMHTGVSIMDQLIWVLDHSNRIAIAATLAHEILHSWQMKNQLAHYRDYSKSEYAMRICEGFAQMGSWLILDTIDHPFARWRRDRMFDNDDEAYGVAFKIIFERYKQIGWHGIIREARLNKLKI